MKAEMVAIRTVALPVGPVRLSLARHDDGHYSGVAALADSGQRIGLLEAGPLTGGRAPLAAAQVDAAVAGPEVRTALVKLLNEAAAHEATARPHPVIQ